MGEYSGFCIGEIDSWLNQFISKALERF